ncbi:Rrf2 family transcriptional regulator [Geothermobacter hydrogeniphilus]|uniref:Rrf2 family transcriptional regulator n=1 Tax=Geothermobacter hydrogeniphilus TaxID=1969733 RepID=A0A2K2H627_9BACT|nr:Rrf2 family transcriptional regulator [Geothermobacter hydrogeniphilus]PNU18775.1 Rrf2 family transcriptional regulator [Geothermobacter hydrogeniphilus]
MKLSTKSRYGLRALFDMAYHGGNMPCQIKDISRRQKISPRYLEQIFQELKKGGLLNSRRGPQGGYTLAKAPDRMTVKDIIEAAEGEVFLVACTARDKACRKNCEFDNQCVTQKIWQEANNRLNDYFSSLSLQDLCEMARDMGLEKELDHRFMYFI